eukprot:5965206-Pleurochrysis_carterae.AAC.1
MQQEAPLQQQISDFDPKDAATHYFISRIDLAGVMHIDQIRSSEIGQNSRHRQLDSRQASIC